MELQELTVPGGAALPNAGINGNPSRLFLAENTCCLAKRHCHYAEQGIIERHDATQGQRPGRAFPTLLFATVQFASQAVAADE
jgi:hypothetical protein